MENVINGYLHHKNINLVILSHTFVSEKKLYREIRNLANYYIIFQNFKYRHNIEDFSRKFFKKSSFLELVFKNINRNIKGDMMYSIPLLIDLRPGTQDYLRARTITFDNPASIFVFMPSNG